MTLQGLTYHHTDDNHMIRVIDNIAKGITYSQFRSFADGLSFSMADWSSFLHLSERSFQRYEKEDRSFDILQSQQIVEIVLLFSHGNEIFDTEEDFIFWLGQKNLALGNITPKELMSTSFGINMIHDLLTRIEHGVLA